MRSAPSRWESYPVWVNYKLISRYRFRKKPGRFPPQAYNKCVLKQSLYAADMGAEIKTLNLPGKFVMCPSKMLSFATIDPPPAGRGLVIRIAKFILLGGVYGVTLRSVHSLVRNQWFPRKCGFFDNRIFLLIILFWSNIPVSSCYLGRN